MYTFSEERRDNEEKVTFKESREIAILEALRVGKYEERCNSVVLSRLPTQQASPLHLSNPLSSRYSISVSFSDVL